MCEIFGFEKERRLRHGGQRSRQVAAEGGRANTGVKSAKAAGFESVGSVVNTLMERLRSDR